ncbi:MAG: hypothetical protein KatS3mg108_2603 [Isosphaeraceae bacterium]|jgi:hypothetical protein|nr:MAG: hypothetical protein KatS3mg108_2603 [Isosphaeraceae bacterium]
MSAGGKREREERALDALLVSALRRADKDDEVIDPDRLPQLTDEEKAAMRSLGSDFVKRLLAGERPLEAKPEQRQRESCDEEDALALAGSGADWGLNRAEEIDGETAEELERRKREILERRARERKEGGGEDA